MELVFFFIFFYNFLLNVTSVECYLGLFVLGWNKRKIKNAGISCKIEVLINLRDT